jgi:hypothetical protein
VFSNLKWKVIAPLIDIGGIVAIFLGYLFYISLFYSAKERGLIHVFVRDRIIHDYVRKVLRYQKSNLKQ